MRFLIAVLVATILSLIDAQVSVAQDKNYTKARFVRLPKSKTNGASIIHPIFDERLYPYHGIGIKLGDPTALTYKFYAIKNFALSVDAGKAANGLYNDYYRNSFMDYLPDTLTANESIRHLSNKVTSDIFLEGKFLYQWDTEKISKGLQIYVGAGWQWRRTNIRYDYLFNDLSPGGNGAKSDRIVLNRNTNGPVAIVGFEYSYFSIPISAFIEIEWFSDVSLDPGYHRFQGGMGLRYVF